MRLTRSTTLVPGVPRAAARAAPAPPGARRASVRPWRALALGCLALAALSLLTPSVPTYDPWAWIIWGREIAHGQLVTTTGPSWKPLPILFTTPFSLAGDAGAPALWLVVARAGGLLAFAMAFRLAARLAGPVAGAIAAASLVLADEFIRNFARGNSEGLLVALCLWAVERHLDGRRRDAFALGLAAALLRPEVWPFIALYGGWLVLSAWRGGGVPWRTLALVGAGGGGLAVLWFVPEYLGSGDFLRAASRARQPNPDSAAFAAFPFVEVFSRSAHVLSPWVYAGGLIAVAVAARAWLRERAGGVRLALAGIATVLMVAVAAMTEGGFAGNLRYVALPAALVCVLAGAGWVELVRAAARRHGGAAAGALAVVVAVAALPFAVPDVRAQQEQWELVEHEAALYGSLPAALERAGGARVVTACGPVYTGPFETQVLAWHLRLHEDQVEIFPLAGGTAVSRRGYALARDPRLRHVLARTAHWTIASSCSGAAGGG